MREIDPQSEPRLTEALRRLAASSSQSAPPALGAGLLAEFRRYHTRRRIRQTSIAALVACLALALSLVFLHKSPQQQQPQIAKQPGAAVGVPKKQSPSPVPVAVATPNNTAKTPKLVSTKANGAEPHAASVSRTFLALPGYDPAVPTDELHVVRVQLPASALWRLGAPMSADAGSRRMTADFVVSQDGTPFAVRLVQ